ncbi:MAG: PAS domain S-box protein, partial [Candidatus Aureabacteria bacterium]|nr:PAS domain S-box protein [Candidatus Auribacterota bacterium]
MKGNAVKSLSGQAPRKIFFICLVISLFWISISDWLVIFLPGDHQHLALYMELNAINDMACLLVTVMLLYALTQRYNRSLRESDTRYRRIVSGGLEGIWEVAADGRTIFANQRMAEMLRCSAEEVESHSLFDFIEPADVNRAREALERQVQGVAAPFEFRY